MEVDLHLPVGVARTWCSIILVYVHLLLLWFFVILIVNKHYICWHACLQHLSVGIFVLFVQHIRSWEGEYMSFQWQVYCGIPLSQCMCCLLSLACPWLSVKLAHLTECMLGLRLSAWIPNFLQNLWILCCCMAYCQRLVLQEFGVLWIHVWTLHESVPAVLSGS